MAWRKLWHVVYCTAVLVSCPESQVLTLSALSTSNVTYAFWLTAGPELTASIQLFKAEDQISSHNLAWFFRPMSTNSTKCAWLALWRNGMEGCHDMSLEYGPKRALRTKLSLLRWHKSRPRRSQSSLQNSWKGIQFWPHDSQEHYAISCSQEELEPSRRQFYDSDSFTGLQAKARKWCKQGSIPIPSIWPIVSNHALYESSLSAGHIHCNSRLYRWLRWPYRSFDKGLGIALTTGTYPIIVRVGSRLTKF